MVSHSTGASVWWADIQTPGGGHGHGRGVLAQDTVILHICGMVSFYLSTIQNFHDVSVWFQPFMFHDWWEDTMSLSMTVAVIPWRLILHSNLAVMAASSCRNGSVAPG